MATTVTVTTEWTQINNLISDNSGFLVTGGTSVELILKENTPLSTDKGTIILRNKFFNIYSSVNTWIRTSGTAKI